MSASTTLTLARSLRLRYRERCGRADAEAILKAYGVSRRTLELWISQPEIEQQIRRKLPGMQKHHYIREALISLCEA
jgi:hypothetical protein